MHNQFALNISSLDDAFSVLNDLKNDRIENVSDTVLNFDPDVFKIKIYVDGDGFDGCSIPSRFAKGLADYQACLYRAAALALYGVEDSRKLTGEDFKVFELVYNVREGSLDLEALIKDLIAGFSSGFTNMDSKHKLIAIIATVLLLVSGATAYYIVASENETEVKLAEDATKREQIGRDIALEKAQTEQFKILADTVKDISAAKGVERNIVEGNRAIIKGADGATMLKMGSAVLDSGKIEEVNARSARARTEVTSVTDEFKVVKMELRDGSVTKFWLSEPTTGIEFQTLMQDENFSEDDLRAVWNAARNRSRIKLELSIARARGQIKSATVLSVPK